MTTAATPETGGGSVPGGGGRWRGVIGPCEWTGVGEHGRRPAEKAENGRLHRSRRSGDGLSFGGYWLYQDSRQDRGDCKKAWARRTCVTHADLPRRIWSGAPPASMSENT